MSRKFEIGDIVEYIGPDRSLAYGGPYTIKSVVVEQSGNDYILGYSQQQNWPILLPLDGLGRVLVKATPSGFKPVVYADANIKKAAQSIIDKWYYQQRDMKYAYIPQQDIVALKDALESTK